MIFITGGYCQGKLEFAKRSFDINENDVLNGENCKAEDIFDKKVIYNFHLLIKNMINSKIDAMAFILENIDRLKDKIIISDEIGLGVVPIDEQERNWREVTGRVCCMIAKEADKVYRIYAGIPVKIKG